MILIITTFIRLIDPDNFDLGFLRNYRTDTVNGIKILNNTSQEIKIAENNEIKIIPPYTSSDDMRILNPQNILIEQQTIFEDKVYNYGCIRLCGNSTFKITTNDHNINTITPPSEYSECKQKNKAGWYKNMEF